MTPIDRLIIKETLAFLGERSSAFRVPPTRFERAIDKLRVKLGFKSRLPVSKPGATITFKRPPRYAPN